MKIRNYIAFITLSVFLMKLVAVDFDGLQLFDGNTEVSFVKHCQKEKKYRDTSKFKAESNQQVSQFDILCGPFFYAGLRSLSETLLHTVRREFTFHTASPADLYFEKHAPPPKSLILS